MHYSAAVAAGVLGLVGSVAQCGNIAKDEHDELVDVEMCVASMEEDQLAALVDGYERGGHLVAGPATHFVVGYAYELGRGTTRDEARACVCYTCAADAGYAPALNRLGLCRLVGRGLPCDPALGVELLRAACTHDYAPAKSNLGVALLTGYADQDRNQAEGMQLLQDSAAAGCADAQYNLGLCHANGWGAEMDLQRAVQCMHAAMEKGHGMALVALGTWHLQGHAGLRQDPALAMQYFEKACQQRVPEAFRHLGSALNPFWSLSGWYSLCFN